MKAFILAAGLGTRLKPLTNQKPKALIEVNGTPMLGIVIKRLISQGFTDLIVNVHYFSEQIIKYLELNDHFGVNISISDESDLLLDTGGAIQKAKDLFDHQQPLLIHNTDVLTDIDLKEFLSFHTKTGALASLAVQKRRSSNYLLFDEDGVLCGWRNVVNGRERISRIGRGEMKQMGFSGIHIIGPDFLELAAKEDCLPVDKKVFSIIGVYLCLAKEFNLKAYDHSDTFWMDIGKHDNLSEAERLLKNGEIVI